MKKWGHIVTMTDLKGAEHPGELFSKPAAMRGPKASRQLLQANPFSMLTGAISSITGAWSSIVSAFKTTFSQQLVSTQFNRGWSKFKESTKVFKGEGLHYDKAPEFFADIRQMIAIPDKYAKDFDSIINFIQFFDKEYWSEHDTTFNKGSGGQASHFTMMANNNQDTQKIDVLFLTCSEDFALAPDVFVISQSHSYLGGIFSSTTLKFKQRPAGLSTQDLQFVSQYFLLLAYQEIALAEQLPQPPDPGFGPPPPPAVQLVQRLAGEGHKHKKCIKDGQGFGGQWPTRPGPPLCVFPSKPGGGFEWTGKSATSGVPLPCCSGKCYTSGYSTQDPYWPFYNCGTCNKPNGCADN